MLQRILVLYLIATSLQLINLLLNDNTLFSKGLQLNEIVNIFTLKAGGTITAYFFLFLLAPFALILLLNDKGVFLLAISSIWYLIYVLFPESAAFPYGTFINVAGLQLLFFSMMWVGYKKYKTQDYGQKVISNRWLITFGLGFLILLAFYYQPDIRDVKKHNTY